MTEPQTYTDRDTEWGAFCADLHALMLAHMADLVGAIGLDEIARNHAPPRITFKHAGSTPVDPIAGGTGPSARQIASCNLHTIAVECWGLSSYHAWAIKRRLDVSLDYLAHGRPSNFGKGKWAAQEGSQTDGNRGVKVAGTFQIRLAVYDDSYYAARDHGRSVAATSAGISVTVVAPDGTGGQTVTLV